MLLILGAVGIGDSTYLTIEALFPAQVQLVCPPGGILNCVEVTSSQYSHVFGIPVAVIGLSYIAMFALTATKNFPSRPM